MSSDIGSIVDWLVDGARSTMQAHEVLAELCDRLVSCGIPLWRVAVFVRTLHPHIKPAGLIARLIGAVTQPGDLVVDPAAGSFVVMRVANQMGRDFVGCDIACRPPQPDGGATLYRKTQADRDQTAGATP